MHPIMLKLLPFLDLETKNPDAFNQVIFDNMAVEMRNHVIKGLYEEGSRGPFTLRFSNVGKPLCQLQMESKGAKRLPEDYNFPIRMLFGNMIESMAMALMRAAGVNIEGEQERVKMAFNVDGKVITIKGTLDVVIDGKVYDLKSASPYSFEKFKSYASLKANDSFGYIEQLYAYSWARKLPPGGWIVINKSSGEWLVLDVPEDYRQEQIDSLEKIRNNIRTILNDEPFRRCFDDAPEVFNRKPTGNRVLKSICTFCPFRYECWPGLQFLPQRSSKAMEPTMKYYTQLAGSAPPEEPHVDETTVSESQGQEVPATNLQNDTGTIPATN